MPPPFIALTGAIAAGKSEALAAFTKLGAATLSSDALVHELLADERVREGLVERWGDGIAPAGVLDRGRVGAIVFERPEELAWLESVLHPLVGERVAEWRVALPPETPLAVVEVPLLFETGMEDAFDATVSRGRRRRRAGRPRRGPWHGPVRESRRPPALAGGKGGAGDLRGAKRRDRGGARGTASLADGRAGRRDPGSAMTRRTGVDPRRCIARRGRRGGRSAASTSSGRCREITLPLQHEDIIRQQAGQTDLDPALIAAVIYAESRFRDQKSAPGARGLMQITPETAQNDRPAQRRNPVRRPGTSPTPRSTSATAPTTCATCSTATAATRWPRWPPTTPGTANVDRWGGAALEVDDIGFPETRAYVEEVLDKQREYRDKYAGELGL